MDAEERGRRVLELRVLCVLCGGVLLWAAAQSNVAAQFGNKPTRPQVEPPYGPVRAVIFTHCTSCHGIDDYAYNALDRAGWNALIDEKQESPELQDAGFGSTTDASLSVVRNAFRGSSHGT